MNQEISDLLKIKDWLKEQLFDNCDSESFKALDTIEQANILMLNSSIHTLIHFAKLGINSRSVTLNPQIPEPQALPVVKDFVAEWYEENKKDLDFAIFDFCVELDELDKTSTEFEDWFDNSLNHPIETLIRMKDGYTIEKPQLFLLKHIDMSNSDKNYDKYLFKDVYGRLQHDTYAKGKQPTDHTCKFTQKEIDTMNIGSYEQIEVEDVE